MTGVLVTNGGPHPADKWAVATAEHIFPIDPSVVGDRFLAAKKLQLAIAVALEPHHEGVQEAERAKLAAAGDDHLQTPHDPLAAAEAALAEIQAAAAGTPWEAHFADAEVQRVVIQEVGNHFATAEHIERQWHCHRNPSDAAKAWLAQHHPGV